MSNIQTIIEEAYEHRAEITPRSVDTVVKDAVLETIELLDRGEIRAAEKKEGQWVVNDWVKKAVMLKFRIQDNQL
ncbi:MAG: 2,3,4,5-tetrahydropyridine-2,6-dicarboxylate N-succinyltransferase, partial [Sedimenticola sp.]